MKILVAEDDQDQLSVRCLLLSHCGFETLAAGDTGSAMALAVAHRPDCAVVDLRLPTEKQGLQLIWELKRLDPAIHVIVLTGGDRGRLAETSEASLVDAVMTKGGASAALIQKLRTIDAGLHAP